METPKEYYYTYYSYEEWGRGYFGSRGCKCLPEEDVRYFGSFSDKTFKPTQKIILKSDYNMREEALYDEIILQKYYKVVENPHFVNRSYQTSTGFSTYGLSPSKETREKKSKKLKGENNPNYGKKSWNDGKGNCKMSVECPGEGWVLGNVKIRGENNPNYGKKWWNDGKGNCKMSVECPGEGWVLGNVKIRGKNNPNYGKSRTKETKRKQSIKSRGKNNHFYGKTHSEETKRKQSEVKRGENNPNYGKKWWNDGNGKTKFTKECPGENWSLGGVKHKTTS